MQINVIRSLEEMNSLQGEWNALVKQGASDVPFLRHEYLSTWWQTLGGGEWSRAELYIPTGRLADGSLAGIAPLFFSPNRAGENALLLLGSIEISDYLDLIVSPQHISTFVSDLFTHLASSDAPAWSVLDWYNILDSSASLPVLQEAASRHGWTYTQEPLQHCPYIPVPGDWEAYLASIDKKQRHEIRRKMRRLESEFEPASWYIVQDEAGIVSGIEDFMSMMAQDPAKNRFLTEAMRTQFRLSTLAAFRAGWLQLAFLEIGGEKAAGYLNFDYKNKLWIYNSALNFAYREYSPGWVLLGYLLQWANENKRLHFDFMRGDEDYKYRFGAIDRRVERVVIRR
jgi:CelD/BcsL family acetyltransferase involved in cellulose biosynthesis